jgi:hypothetical protein
MFGKMMMKLLHRPCKDKVMEHISSGYEAHQLEATRMSTFQMLEYLRTEDAWSHLLPYRPPVSFPISRPVWGRTRKVSPEIEAVPISDEEGEDGFIVEVEEEDGDGDSLEEEEGMVSSKDSSEEPIVTSTSTVLETTTDVIEPISDSTDGQTDEISEPIESVSDEQDEEFALNGNRKRKSPPLPISRATKRRSSDEHHPIDIDISNSNEVALPKRNLSEESFTSSDTQPLTPPLHEIELRRIQRERAVKEPRIARSEVPHIPAPGVHLGRGTEELFRSVYEVALDPYICCRCGVCMRRWQ